MPIRIVLRDYHGEVVTTFLPEVDRKYKLGTDNSCDLQIPKNKSDSISLCVETDGHKLFVTVLDGDSETKLVDVCSRREKEVHTHVRASLQLFSLRKLRIGRRLFLQIEESGNPTLEVERQELIGLIESSADWKRSASSRGARSKVLAML